MSSRTTKFTTKFHPSTTGWWRFLGTWLAVTAPVVTVATGDPGTLYLQLPAALMLLGVPPRNGGDQGHGEPVLAG